MKIYRRKKNKESDVLSKTIRIRITNKDYDYLKNKVDASGLTDVSKLIRMIIRKSNIIITSRSDVEATLQLKRIGVNINQAIKLLHLSQNYELRKLYLEDLNKCIESLRVILKNQ